MTDVFISYASVDRERARKLANALEALGWSVWWDRMITTGDSFDRVIEHELERAKSVVVLWSKESIDSEWVKNEATVASARGVLVPALIDSVKLPLEFRRKQTADLVGWNGDSSHAGFQSLCDGVAAKANITSVLPRANTPRWRSFRWNRRWSMGVTTAIIVLTPLVSRIPSEAFNEPKSIEGIWYAEIPYCWGKIEMERFDFTVDGERLIGTASLNTAPRQIVDGRLSKDRLYFTTKEPVNYSTYAVDRVYQYRGNLKDSQIQFTLDTGGWPQTKFVAARTVEEARRFLPRLPTGGTEPSMFPSVSGPYEPDHIGNKLSHLYPDVKQCYVATEFDPIEHSHVYYFLKIAPDGSAKETGAPGTDQRSVELDRCMDRAFRSVNWGARKSGDDVEIRVQVSADLHWCSK